MTSTIASMIEYRRSDVFRSRDLFKFWDIFDNIREVVKSYRQLQWKAIRKSYLAYRMAPISMTFRSLLLFKTFLTPLYR